MQLSVHARSSAVSLWVVSNGDVTIGPVRTELLLRGIRHGRVPLDCQVREAGSDVWRPLSELREVAALQGHPGSIQAFQRAAHVIAHARDERDVLLTLLHGASEASRASRGLLHRHRAPIQLPVTSYAVGGLEDALGTVIPSHDPAYVIARSGRSVIGRPEAGDAERAIAGRLGTDGLRGVVMVPVTYGTEIAAMLELGRDDRPFRAGDADQLTRLATLAIARLEELIG
jgi:hypothetical protein